MILNRLKDIWFLFGRLFPFPTKPGLRRVGCPGRSSPVLVTCNFELTVRKVIRTLEHDQIDAWLLVAPTKGINVWCAASGGHFTADTVISVLKTSGIENLVDHRKLILPQLSAAGVNIWALKDRSGWKPRFGPADIKDIPAYLHRGKQLTERKHRRVGFPLKDRLIMGTNLAFNALLFLILPLLLMSIWVSGLWWKSILSVLLLSVLTSALVFRLPGKPGVQKGLSLGIILASVFAVVALASRTMGSLETLGWSAGIILLATYLGFDLPGWSPLWRADVNELLRGVKNTQIRIVPEKCIGCVLCDLVCPANVFGKNPMTRKYEVLNLDACQACGACIENCPTEAIENNFRTGVCSCPTCAVIKGVKSLTSAQHEEQEKELAATNSCCGSTDCEDNEVDRVE
ncbi:MAG: 4Fe-4S dicluster domain-containing protein [FCB group bacterium]|nr:4Fe-4S dicluster domain-containing protein [FCB group bacterium]